MLFKHLPAEVRFHHLQGTCHQGSQTKRIQIITRIHLAMECENGASTKGPMYVTPHNWLGTWPSGNTMFDGVAWLAVADSVFHTGRLHYSLLHIVTYTTSHIFLHAASRFVSIQIHFFGTLALPFCQKCCTHFITDSCATLFMAFLGASCCRLPHTKYGSKHST